MLFIRHQRVYIYSYTQPMAVIMAALGDHTVSTSTQNNTSEAAVTADPKAVSLVVIAKSERAYAESFGHICSRVFPAAEMEYHFKGAGLINALQGRRINFLLIGLHFPDTDGVDLIQEICKQRLAEHIVVIAEKHYRPLLAALRTSRVDAIIDTFNDSMGTIRAALRSVQNGQVYVSPLLEPYLKMRHQTMTKLMHLTQAELRVLRIIGSGIDDSAAAGILGVSEATVHSHRRSIMGKFKVSSSAKMVYEAVRLGFVRMPSMDTVLAPDGVKSILLP